MTPYMKPLYRYHLLAAVMVTFILRMSLPQVRYVFYPLFLFLLVYHLAGKENRKGLLKTIKYQAWYLILLGVFTAAAIYHSSFFRPYLEAVNGLELALLFAIVFYHINGKAAFRSFSHAFFLQLFLLTMLVGLIGLFRLGVLLNHGVGIDASERSLISLESDYNFFVLSLLYGFFLGVYFLLSGKDLNRRTILFLNLALVILALDILVVPSRRGMDVFTGIIVLMVLSRLVSMVFSQKLYFSSIRRLDPLLLVLLTGILGLNAFFLLTSDDVKKQMLIGSGLYRIDFRERVTNMYHRYARMIDRDLEYREAYQMLWQRDQINRADPSEDSPAKMAKSSRNGQSSFAQAQSLHLKRFKVENQAEYRLSKEPGGERLGFLSRVAGQR